MRWTDERVELLKKLWQDGLSASHIAKQLGGGHPQCGDRQGPPIGPFGPRHAVKARAHHLQGAAPGASVSSAPSARRLAEPVSLAQHHPAPVRYVEEAPVRRPC